jgi:AraC-like DNA-binding protein
LTVDYETRPEPVDAAADSRNPQHGAASTILRLGALTARLLDGARDAPSDLHLDEVRVFMPLTFARVSLAAASGLEVLRAPDVCILPPGMRAQVRIDPGSEGGLLVALDTLVCEERAVRTHGRPARIDAVHAGPDAPLHEMLHGLAADLRAGRAVEPTDPRADAVALHLAATYGVPQPASSCAGLARPRLERALAMIEERLTDALPVADLAEAVHLSPFHFSRMFRVSTGRSPHEWIMLKRMARAKLLLATTRLTLPEVAKGAGYRTHSHFSGMFHAVVKMTPGQYRARHA